MNNALINIGLSIFSCGQAFVATNFQGNFFTARAVWSRLGSILHENVFDGIVIFQYAITWKCKISALQSSFIYGFKKSEHLLLQSLHALIQEILMYYDFQE